MARSFKKSLDFPKIFISMHLTNQFLVKLAFHKNKHKANLQY